jgi:hypothetical protein
MPAVRSSAPASVVHPGNHMQDNRKGQEAKKRPCKTAHHFIMPFMSDVLHCLPAATPRRPIFVVVRPADDIHHNAYPDHHQKKDC